MLMPQTKKYRGKKKMARRGRKKVYKKRQQGASTTIVRAPGFTDTLYTKLKYADNILIAPFTPQKVYTFRGNSLYDPDFTGTGHQPMYFDQYAGIYSRYRVMGCKIKADVINVSGSAAAYVVLQAGTDNFTGSSLSQLLEQTRAGIARTVPVASRFPMSIKMYTSTRKACGLNKKQVFDEDFSAPIGSNPNSIWYYNFQFESVDGVNNVNCQVMFTLTYYVQFFDRVIAAQS